MEGSRLFGRLAVGTACAVLGLRRLRRRRSTRRRRRTPASPTSSTARRRARTRRSTSGSSPPARSISRGRHREGGQGQATLEHDERRDSTSARRRSAPTGTPVKPFGDAVFRIQYTVQNTPTSTRNGGVMIRSPEIRYTCPDPTTGAPAQCASTNNDVLPKKPVGFNFDVCPGAIPLCGLTAPAPSTTYTWAGASGPFPPPASTPAATARARRRPASTTSRNLAGTGPLTVNGNANNHQHWTQVYCGHEIQINETLTGGGPQPSTDPIKTGSVYGFRNLNAQQSRHERAPGQGRLARVRDPHDRPAVHGPGRRQDDQPVRQLDPEDRVAQR